MGRDGGAEEERLCYGGGQGHEALRGDSGRGMEGVVGGRWEGFHESFPREEERGVEVDEAGDGAVTCML